MNCEQCCKWTKMAVGLFLAAGVGLWVYAAEHEEHQWEVHDMNRPVPPVVDPGPAPEKPAPIPADAIVLFDGKDLSKWHTNGQNPQWKIENGYAEVNKGGIATRDGFGDCQLHVEWASPVVVKGKSQERGNSGIFLMSKYEVQVLDNYDNRTYADGMAASLYGQHPPLVNACRKPGEWQTYDIIFHRPKFKADGTVEKRGTMTVFHNGILVQDNVEIWGGTQHKTRGVNVKHGDREPISIQDHGNPVRFRSIWIRDLEKK